VPKAEEEHAKHEGRLAKALDFDRAERVFEYVDMSISPTNPTINKRKHMDIGAKTVWKGTEWVLEGSRESKNRMKESSGGFLPSTY
jgi:hypothetical protein